MYSADKPIQSSQEDRLGRKDFACQLAEAIIKLSSTDTFVVGLYGEWGSGKTSVLNLTTEVLNKLSRKEDNPKVTIIRFNPWGYTDGTQLVQQFFSVLSNEIQSDTSGKKKAAIGDALEKYSFLLNYLKFIPVVGPFLDTVPELAQKIGSQLKEGVLSGESNIQSQKEVVKRVLATFHRKIVIIIDDIDRLPNEQIRMIFQLVNSVADFPNTTYILSFDYTIVCRALAVEQNCKGEDYLEKIIQIPFILPEISPAKIESILLPKFEELLAGTLDGLFDKNHWNSVYKKCVVPYISSMRDVVRLINALEFKYIPMKNLINPIDFIGITVIENFAPDLYNWIKSNKFLLTDSSGYHNGYTGNARIQNKTKWEEAFKGLFGVQAELYMKSVLGLFPLFSSGIEFFSTLTPKELRGKLHIGHAERFDSYFTLSVENNLVSFPSTYASLYLLNEEANLQYLNKVVESGVIKEYIANLRDLISEIPDNRVNLLMNNFFAIINEIPVDPPAFFTLGSDINMQYIIRDLLMRITEEQERLEVFLNQIEHSNIEVLLKVATLINMFELAQGRLAGDHIKENEIVFSVDSLLHIEALYTSKVQEGLKEYNILDSTDFQIGSYIWKCFDGSNYATYMRDLLTMNKNRLLYIARNAHMSNSSRDGLSWSFNIQRDFQEFLTIEQAKETINQAIDSKELFSMPSKLQNRIGAFVLYSEGPNGESNTISDTRAQEWVASKAREVKS